VANAVINCERATIINATKLLSILTKRLYWNDGYVCCKKYWQRAIGNALQRKELRAADSGMVRNRFGLPSGRARPVDCQSDLPFRLVSRFVIAINGVLFLVLLLNDLSLLHASLR